MKASDPADSQMGQLLTWARKFNELSIRERALISAAVLGVTWAIWYFLINLHFSDTRSMAERQLQMIKAEQATKVQLRDQLLVSATQDPNKPVERKINRARADLTAMQSRLHSSLAQFIPPKKMTLVLKDLMAEHKRLQLTLLKRLPARELLPDEENANLYLHPIQLELEGEYLDVLDYVASVENGDWQFNWRNFEYKTKGYPNGVARIEIETLSKDKHWLGL